MGDHSPPAQSHGQSHKQVPLWRQRASNRPGGLVVWDYHVWVIQHTAKPDMGPLVWDLDTTLGFPCALDEYATQALQCGRVILDDTHARMYRIVPAQRYLAHFASDRRHMLATPHTASIPQPPYPCIRGHAAASEHELPKFLNMQQATDGDEVASYASTQQPSRRKPNWPFAAPAIPTPPAEWHTTTQGARAFASPDAPAAMATVLGAGAALMGLRGSVCHGPADAYKALDDARGVLKGKLRSAWSSEALQRGVQHARAGDVDLALPLYTQALELDPGNADALVAQGAAYGNMRRYQDAVDVLLKALALQPGHANAQKYLTAVKNKATAAGVMLQLIPPPSRGVPPNTLTIHGTASNHSALVQKHPKNQNHTDALRQKANTPANTTHTTNTPANTNPSNASSSPSSSSSSSEASGAPGGHRAHPTSQQRGGSTTGRAYTHREPQEPCGGGIGGGGGVGGGGVGGGNTQLLIEGIKKEGMNLQTALDIVRRHASKRERNSSEEERGKSKRKRRHTSRDRQKSGKRKKHKKKHKKHKL